MRFFIDYEPDAEGIEDDGMMIKFGSNKLGLV